MKEQSKFISFWVRAAGCTVNGVDRATRVKLSPGLRTSNRNPISGDRRPVHEVGGHEVGGHEVGGHEVVWIGCRVRQ